MTRTRTVRYAAAIAVVVAAGIGLARQQTVVAQGRGNTQVPRLEVDPLWPRPFPYEKHWALGSVTGVAIDTQDHIWVVNRGTASLQNNEKGPSLATWASECCFGAPQVLEFDAEGTLLASWEDVAKGQGYVWPQNPSAIAVDAKGNVWIAAGGYAAATGGGRRGAPPAAAPGGAAAGAGAGRAAGGAAPAGADAAAGAGRGAGRGRGAGAPGGAAPGAAAGGAAPAAGAAGRGGAAAAGAQARGGAAPAAAAPAVADAHVIKFDKTGKALLTIGTPGKTDESDTTLNGPQGIAIDDAANEVYIADSGNKRVMVFDANSGAFKRKFSASGGTPLKDVSCVKLAKDGTVYVCDSANNRIVSFKKDGSFVKEGTVKAGTGGMVLGGAGGAQGTVYSFGSAWDIAFSNDAQQRFLYVADGMNKTVWVVQRDTLAPVSRIGDGGRYPGMFYAVSSVAVDSKGNLYTGEDSDGKRVQRFVNRGMTAPRPLN